MKVLKVSILKEKDSNIGNKYYKINYKVKNISKKVRDNSISIYLIRDKQVLGCFNYLIYHIGPGKTINETYDRVSWEYQKNGLVQKWYLNNIRFVVFYAQ